MHETGFLLFCILEGTLEPGAGLCDYCRSQCLVSAGSERCAELMAVGADFDMKDGRISFTREGALAEPVSFSCDATGRLPGSAGEQLH